MVNKDRRCKRKRHPCVEGHAQNIIDFGRVVGGQGAGQAFNRKNREQASSSSLSQPSCSSINEEQLVICMTCWQIIPVYVYVVFCGLVCMDRHIGGLRVCIRHRVFCREGGDRQYLRKCQRSVVAKNTTCRIPTIAALLCTLSPISSFVSLPASSVVGRLTVAKSVPALRSLPGSQARSMLA